MKMWQRLIFLGIFAAACSSKQAQLKPTETPSAPAANENSAPTSFYFCDLQILTETTPEGSCPAEKKIAEAGREDLRLRLNEANELEPKEKLDFKYFASNVTLEVIGFDSAKYTFTVFDGVIPRPLPFPIRIRRTPGQVLELHFLDQVVQMKLLTTPIYTFSATEKRGDCTLKHNVNVFAERVGYFKKKLVPL